MIQNNNSATLKFSIYLTALIFAGYLLLLMLYMTDPNHMMNAYGNVEFTPVFVIAFSFLYVSFTCGELFGHLNHPALLFGKPALIKPARRALSLFLFSIIFFYFLRAGFDEDIYQKIALMVLPGIIFAYLFYFLYIFYDLKVFQKDYTILKIVLLAISAKASFLGLLKLFFPEILEKLLTLV